MESLHETVELSSYVLQKNRVVTQIGKSSVGKDYPLKEELHELATYPTRRR